MTCARRSPGCPRRLAAAGSARAPRAWSCQGHGGGGWVGPLCIPKQRAHLSAPLPPASSPVVSMAVAFTAEVGNRAHGRSLLELARCWTTQTVRKSNHELRIPIRNSKYSSRSMARCLCHRRFCPPCHCSCAPSTKKCQWSEKCWLFFSFKMSPGNCLITCWSGLWLPPVPGGFLLNVPPWEVQ